MKIRLIVATLAAAALFACNSAKTQRSPSLTASPAKPAAPQRDVLKEAGDTTWQVVTAPARLVTPKKANPKQPEVYEAPAAVIVRRSYTDDDAAPAPAPATAPQKP